MLGLGNTQKRTSWTINVPSQERRYYWSVQAVDGAYAGSPFTAEQIVDHPSGANELPVPTRFVLHENVPNPFNPTTVVCFEIPSSSLVTLEVFDASGRHVRTLLNEMRPAGIGKLPWNGTNDRGQPVASGVYLCQMKVANFTATRQMTLVK